VNLGVTLLPQAEIGQEKDHDNPCRFLPASCFLSASHCPVASGLGLSRKPDASKETPASRIDMISTEKFRYFEKIPISSPIYKGSDMRMIWKQYGRGV
jgi:hypothetical protein